MTPTKAHNIKEGVQYKLLKKIKTEGKQFPIGSIVTHGRVDLDGTGGDAANVIRINDYPIFPWLVLDVEEITQEVTQ